MKQGGRWLAAIIPGLSIALLLVLGWLWVRLPRFPAPALPADWSPGCELLGADWQTFKTVGSEQFPLAYFPDEPDMLLVGSMHAEPPLDPSGSPTYDYAILRETLDGRELARLSTGTAQPWVVAVVGKDCWLSVGSVEEESPALARLMLVDRETLAERGSYPLPVLEGTTLNEFEGLFALADGDLALLAGGYSEADNFASYRDYWVRFNPATLTFTAHRRLTSDENAWWGMSIYHDDEDTIHVVPSGYSQEPNIREVRIDLKTGEESFGPPRVRFDDEAGPIPLPRQSPLKRGYAAVEVAERQFGGYETNSSMRPVVAEVSLPGIIATEPGRVSFKDLPGSLAKMRKYLWAKQAQGDFSTLAVNAARLDALVFFDDSTNPPTPTVLEPEFGESVQALGAIGMVPEEEQPSYQSLSIPPATPTTPPTTAVSWRQLPPPITALEITRAFRCYSHFDGDRALLVQSVPVPLPQCTAPFGIVRLGWITPGQSTITWWGYVRLPFKTKLGELRILLRRDHPQWLITLWEPNTAGGYDLQWMPITVESEQHPTRTPYWVGEGSG